MVTADRIVRSLLRGLLLAVIIGPIGCGGGNFPPKPPSSPSPGPSAAPTPPPPKPYQPITIQGRTFMQGGKPFVMKSIVPCCNLAEKWGWPAGNEVFIRDAARLGANMVEVRLGPYGVEGETRLDDVSGFLPVNPTQVNLDLYYEPYWVKRDKVTELAKTFGITVVYDLDDGWAMRTENWSAFNRGANIQNVDEANCAITREPLTARHKSWLRNALQRTSKHANVMYHVSNEVMLCKPSREWIQGIVDMVRQYAPGKLVGDNSQEDWSCSVAGYASFHSASPASPRDCPAVVNETKDTILTGFGQNWKQANADGTYFMFWAGNRTMAQVEAELVVWSKPLPPPGEGDDIGWGGENGDLPYLKACIGNPNDKIIMPEPAGIKCICSKQSGPCPAGMKEDATGKAMSTDLRNGPKDPLSLGESTPNGVRITNVPAYMASVVRIAQSKGYCAKFSGWDEVWIKKPGSGKSYGFDVIHDPATGGRFTGTFKNVVQCTPAGL